MERAHEDLFGIGFLDYLAQIHYGYAIGYVFDHGEVVGDEQVRETELLLKLAKEVQYLRLYRNVEGRYGFVAHDELRLQRERSCDAYALPLPAREFVRVTACVLGIEAYKFEKLGDSLTRAAARWCDHRFAAARTPRFI
jgi:hypothetical protein